ncbi:MAG: GNAT family N-acetyltransferase [Alphaproteobacteria bacterium]|nr:GNAT family N-acetyltransferase [Alphaproteobacteria bacterium]
MNREAESFRITADTDGSVAKWVCAGLNEDADWVGSCVTMAVYRGSKLIAGIIFNDIRPGRDVWLTIYSTDKRWCSRRILRCIFSLVFDEMACHRASLFVSKGNRPSIKLVEGLGFVREGLLRQYRDNGDDCYVYGMLKNECKWR